MTGRVVVVTGANAGIGAVTARELARAGAHVFLAGRSEERTRPVVDAIVAETGNTQVEYLPLDLASLSSVRAAAEAFLARDLPLHVLINNAGVAGTRGTTEEGFELAFGVNHLGHFLFTMLLRDRIVRSAPARIVTVASRAHYRARGIDFDAVRKPTRSLTGFPEYGVSKLANVLFSQELGRRLGDTGVSTYALHPGVVASEIWRRLGPLQPLVKRFMISTEEGAKTTLHCATDPQVAVESGQYWDECRPMKPSRHAHDEGLARDLWDRSLDWTGAG